MSDRPDLKFESRMLIDGRLVEGEAGTFDNISARGAGNRGARPG